MSTAQVPAVLESFPPPRPTSVNPFTHQLASHLGDAGVTVHYFSWRTALLGRYDLVHVHWPEILVSGRTPIRALVRQLLTLFLVARLTATRRPLVRTVHNLELPDGLSPTQRLVLRAVDRATTLRIVLTPRTPVPAGAAVVTIVHPHFRDWFTDYQRSEPVPGQLGFVGRIRRYKGVESLIGAVAGAGGVTARIAGYPSSAELADTVQRLAGESTRVAVEFGFVSDARLVEVVTSSELVVLPYTLMHNSGTAITALSLDRPVLVPHNPVTSDLQAEVGEGWVHTFTGELDADDILRALGASRMTRTPPRLDAREWEGAAQAHVAAFRQALELAGRS